jgi:hypothetical protein
MRNWAAIALLFFSAAAGAAESPQKAAAPARAPQTDLELLEQRESFEKVMGLLKEAEVSLDAMTRTRKLQCLKALGSEAFCECLNEKLAVGLDFSGYIGVIIRTKDELKYSTLSKEDRGLVDSAINTRNACAK